MKKTFGIKNRIIAILLALITALPGAFCLRAYAVSGVNTENVINDIFKDELVRCEAGSIQAMINGKYAAAAGASSDWLVFSLIQFSGSKYDYTAYAKALKKFVESSSDPTYSTTKERYALLFAAMNTNKPYIDSVLKTEVGSLGIMSYIYGLHLVANGYKASLSADKIISETLALRRADGGWSITGTAADVDVTAMAVQGLAPYYGSNSDVKSAVDAAVSLLSSRQLANGCFSSYGSENPESCAQVITALTSLGINPLTDSRFIKNDKSVVDAMLSYKASDRGYTHKAGGTFNLSATSQVLYSMISLWRLQNSKGRLYQLNAGVTVTLPAETTTVKETTKTTVKAPSGSQAGTTNRPAATSPAVVPGTTAPTTKAPDKTTTQGATAPTFTRRTSTTTTKAQKTATKAAQTEKTTAAPAKTTAAKADTSAKADVKDSTTAAAVQTETVTEATGTTAAETTYFNTEITLPGADTEGDGEITYTEETEYETQADSFSPETEEEESSAEERFPLKAAAIIAIWALAAIAAVILLAKKNRKIINYIIIALVAAALTAGAAVSDLQWPEEFFTPDETSSQNTITVTMSIDCKTVAGRGSEDVTPADGIILAPTEFVLDEGATAYDCLVAAAKEYQIQFEDSTRMLTDHRGAYISGINYLYEFNYGEMSGWMFSVNGDFGDVGCGEYTLSDGDLIEWRYTTNIGDDLK